MNASPLSSVICLPLCLLASVVSARSFHKLAERGKDVLYDLYCDGSLEGQSALPWQELSAFIAGGVKYF